MNTALDYLGLAALTAMRTQATSKALPRTRADFVESVEQRYGWKIDVEQAEQTIRQLKKWGYLTALNDRYAGESLLFSKLSTDSALYQNLPEEIRTLYGQARQGGVPWFRDVFNNQSFWNDLHQEGYPPDDDEDHDGADTNENTLVPASDRIVTIGDNRRAIEVISSDVRGLSEEIRESNEISVELGEEKEIIEGEFRAAETLLAQPSFRLQRLYALLIPALRFLAEKFATGAIGDLAKRLIAALIGLA